MSLAEGTQASIAFKRYTSGAIVANTQDQAPGTSGAQYIRRVSSNLDLTKNTYTSAEIRSDRQITDFRHGTRHSAGDIVGELSPGTWFDFIEAIHRDTKVGSLSLTNTDLTSVGFSHSGSSITFGSGDPVALGLFVGDVVRFTGVSQAADNSVNFTILGFSGSSNRTLSVTPAPSDTASPDTSFSLTRPGHTTIVPSSGFVSYKYGIEIADPDIDISRLFTEVRAVKYAASLPATGLVSFTGSFMGRDMLPLSGTNSPYFVTPTAETTTGVTAAVNGLALVDGTALGVLTGINLQLDTAASVAEVVGQNFPAEIFLGRANVTGQIQAFVEDVTLIDYFVNEGEISLLAQLTTSSAANAPAVTIFLPRVKLGGATVNLSGEGGQQITAPFQALKYVGTAPGMPVTTIRWHDTEA